MLFDECDWDDPRRRKLPRSVFFNDGIRRIDFILAFEPKAGGRRRRLEFMQFRQKYEQRLKQEGLELEYVGQHESHDRKTAFVKVHAPWAALARQAELQEIQMPVMVSDLEGKPRSWSRRLATCCGGKLGDMHALQSEYKFDRIDYFTDSFERDRVEDFLMEDAETFFHPATRIYLAWSIMSSIMLCLELQKSPPKKKSKFDIMQMAEIDPNVQRHIQLTMDDCCQNESVETYTKSANIEYLVKEGIYKAVYPIHDSKVNEDVADDVPVKRWPLRKYLYEAWARPRQWFRYQPIEQIRNYYGVEMAMYFAFLGYYTKMLVPAALFGVLIFVSGIFLTIGSDKVDALCINLKEAGSPLRKYKPLCRPCPSVNCPYETGNFLCVNAVVATLFDNLSATVYALIMAIWGVTFINLWRRYQSELCQRWDVGADTNVQKYMRPEFVLKATSIRVNPVTCQPEPYLPTASKIRRRIASYSILLFFIAIVLALLVVFIAYYHMGPMVWARLYKYTDEQGNVHVDISTSLTVSLTASLINGAFVAIMQRIFGLVSWKLTELELPRTEEEFETSHTYKTFLFHFVNYYGALFYLAFVRGQLTTPPDGSWALGRCPAVGCLLEVAIQLAIIMVGKQALNNLLEIGLPYLTQKFKKSSSRLAGEKEMAADETREPLRRWESDLELTANPPLQLYKDYQEMVIQYGFITFFVAAFPLAPLFALVNNIIEIRIDASKNLLYSRRCIPTRPKDIGPWFDILTIMSRLAVLTNAALIAFNTDICDRIVYQFYKDVGRTDKDFLGFTMSTYHTEDWCQLPPYNGNMSQCQELLYWKHNEGQHKITKCLYRGYQQRNDETGLYELTMVFYIVLIVKLLFILLFEHFVFLVQGLLDGLIGDVPNYVKVRLERQAYLRGQAFKRQELIEAAQQAVDEDETDFVESDNPWMDDLEKKMAEFEAKNRQEQKARLHAFTRSEGSGGQQLSVFGRVNLCVNTLSQATGRFFKDVHNKFT